MCVCVCVCAHTCVIRFLTGISHDKNNGMLNGFECDYAL